MICGDHCGKNDYHRKLHKLGGLEGKERFGCSTNSYPSAGTVIGNAEEFRVDKYHQQYADNKKSVCHQR